MGLRFRKSVKVGPMRVNISKSGVGYSVGGKGYRVTKKANGGMRTTASIPGTGISYVKDYSTKTSAKSSISTSRQTSATAPISQYNNTPNPAQVSGSDTSGLVHCRHCYKATPADSKFCTICGKSQAVDPGSSKKSVWCIVCLILGLILMGTLPLIALILLVASVCLGLSILKANKNYKPVPVVYVVDIPSKAKDLEREARIKEQADAVVKALREESIRQAFGDDAVSNEEIPETEVAKKPNRGENHRATGMEHYLDNIMELAFENDDYDLPKKELIECYSEGERVWKYEFHPANVELVPEPENPYDPNAIKVVVDSKHVAYIKRGSCSKILKAIREGTIHRIICEMGGGPYKAYYEDDDGKYSIERGEVNYFVHLTIYKDQV